MDNSSLGIAVTWTEPKGNKTKAVSNCSDFRRKLKTCAICNTGAQNDGGVTDVDFEEVR